MTAPQRHDWQKIIADLEAKGYSLWKLALMAHVDTKTMQAWAQGKSEPRHSVGEWLLERHAEVSHETSGEIPRGENLAAVQQT